MVFSAGMAKQSAGLLVYRTRDSQLEVFLVHPGGPFWAKKDAGAWSIPKGLCDECEDAFAAAKRELKEETGIVAAGDFLELGTFKQPGGKTILAWATEMDFDPANLHSNMFAMEWPPKSGRKTEFPEVDRAEWFSLPAARTKLLPGQLPLLDEIEAKVGAGLK